MSHTQMLINYVPGEECRVAVVEDRKLEEFHTETADQVSRVGNIYVGVVTNVEAAIQAAFVDFGSPQHGFLHVTDVHPRYFPGEDDDTTERVGKKTPRRDRPPIQHSLKRGQEIAVQVLKEGVGTKGPTLTSYLSIPGRYLVMMPWMDRVGVSRKVEDDELRRRMREILDQLELPDGFGFILRTAGFDRNKTELKRDQAYLQRLWKDMEKRWHAGNGPRLLYAESDLLLRALRDILGPETGEVVIDNEHALRRAGRFLKIVSPRSSVKLMHYTGRAPLLHAFGVEEQVMNMHAREVPLPSGGRLVFEQTEALVAIDVNSGKSRSARDSETNAYQTNVEAVDEICRQLRLRDLGGVVVNDLIDMRHASHRKDIETRMKERLKRDRAKTTTLPISGFGILEMTRQRMRGSHESVHFIECPTCRGRGLVQRPDSIARDALRGLGALLAEDRIARIEMVVGPRVASELLSSRRKSLTRLERQSGKHVDVRVSETVAIDRVAFYAYDEAGADVDIERLSHSRKASDLKPWEDATAADWAVDVAAEGAAEPEPEPAVELPVHPIEFDAPEEPASAAAPDAEAFSTSAGRKKRGRRGGRGRGRGARGEEAAPQERRIPRPAADTEPPAQEDDGAAPFDGSQAGHAPHAADHDGEAPRAQDDGRAQEQGGGRRRRRRRRRGRGGRGGEGGPNGQVAGGEPFAPAQPELGQPLDEFQSPEPRDGNEEAPFDGAMPHDGPDYADETGAPVPEVGTPAGQEPGGGGRRRRRRRRRRGGGSGSGGEAGGVGGEGEPRAFTAQAGGEPHHDDGQPGAGHAPHQQPHGQPRPPQERREQGRRDQGRRDQAPPQPREPQARQPRPVAPAPPQPPPAAPQPRSLYGASRRRLSASERAKLGRSKG